MAKTTVENLVCQACGADVRENSLFCYHCGGSVAPELVVALKDRKNVGNVRFHKITDEEKKRRQIRANQTDGYPTD